MIQIQNQPIQPFARPTYQSPHLALERYSPWGGLHPSSPLLLKEVEVEVEVEVEGVE